MEDTKTETSVSPASAQATPAPAEPSLATALDRLKTMDLSTFGEIVPVADKPQSLDATDRTGKEGIRPDELQLPRLTVAQGLHPQVVPGDPKYIQGLAIGQMFNDLSEVIYGTGPLTVVPVYRNVVRIEFDPNDRNVVLDRDVPPGDKRLDWSKGTGKDGEDEPPRATEFYEFVSLLLRPGKEPERVVVSIKTTNKEMKRAAKQWTTYVDNRSGPIYSGMYRVTSHIIKGKNKKGQETLYGVFVVKNAGYIPKDTPAGEALFEYAKRFHEASKTKGYEVTREGHTQEDTDFDPATLERQPVAGEVVSEM